jgi:hypothetical protein
MKENDKVNDEIAVILSCWNEYLQIERLVNEN